MNQKETKKKFGYLILEGSKDECLSPPSNYCIFTVPEKLRQTHREAFSPKLVSIGPFYHGTQWEAMQEHKWRYLQRFLKQKPMSVEECVKAIKKWEVELASVTRRTSMSAVMTSSEWFL
ncbi:hypothetical protein NL676_035316 [Syzygium grande]|nr:hypothetical protein NL676_035316 [Syzygium grande]